MIVKQVDVCVSQVRYHLMLPVKYKALFLSERFDATVGAISKEIGERYQINFERIGCDKSHLHALCSFDKTLNVGELVNDFKAMMAKELVERIPSLKQELGQSDFWLDGYYASTIAKGRNWSVVKEYITNQGKDLQVEQLRLFDVYFPRLELGRQTVKISKKEEYGFKN